MVVGMFAILIAATAGGLYLHGTGRWGPRSWNSPLELSGEFPEPRPVAAIEPTEPDTPPSIEEPGARSPPPTVAAPSVFRDAGSVHDAQVVAYASVDSGVSPDAGADPHEMSRRAEGLILRNRHAEAYALLQTCLERFPGHERCLESDRLLGMVYTPPRKPVEPVPAGRQMALDIDPRDLAPEVPSRVAPPPPPVRRAPVRSLGRIKLKRKTDEADIYELSDGHHRRIRECVDASERRGRPARLQITVLLHASGHPQGILIEPMNWGATRTAHCMKEVVMGWRFPSFKGPSRKASFEVELEIRR